MNNKKNNFRYKILKGFDLLENIFSLTFAFGLFFLTKEIIWAKIVLWVGIIGLSFLYLIKSFEAPKDDLLTYLVYKITWISYILALFGIYSKLEVYENSQILLYIAFLTLLVSIITLIFFRNKFIYLFNTKDILRNITFFTITLAFIII